MVSRIAVEDAQDGETTIPARKLFEIIRALPDGSRITVSQTGDKITVQAGRSRFTLATLPSNDFPSVDEVEATERVAIGEATLKELIERTAFAMAQQDVRYYLNGLLFDLRGSPGVFFQVPRGASEFAESPGLDECLARDCCLPIVLGWPSDAIGPAR